MIHRIYEHALEQGYLEEGDTVLDPFGGVALGGLDAMFHGLHWIGVELEAHFCDLAGGYDCDGKVALKIEKVMPLYHGWCIRLRPEGRHWEFRTEQEAKDALPDIIERDDWDADAYEIILFEPDTEREMTVMKSARCGLNYDHEPHHVEGNIELWNRRYGNGKLRRWGTATILQGDSRRLVEVLEGARTKGIIASPPFCESLGSTDIDFIRNRLTTGPSGSTKLRGTKGAQSDGQIYGTDPANLGNMPTGEPPQAIIGSPPWLETLTTKPKGEYGFTEQGLLPDGTQRGGSIITGDYGTSDGQLAALPEGEPLAAIVSSPPWESSSACEDPNYRINRQTSGGPLYNDYGNHPDQQGDTFWGAARTILLQCHQVLAPGGAAIWVLKAFIRGGKIVNFPGQWQSLCESCGFETIEIIRAWLVEERGTQYDLKGEAHTKIVERKSFFRRLAEKKGSPRIDYEIVLIAIRS